MTAKELKEALANVLDDAEVYIDTLNGSKTPIAIFYEDNILSIHTL